MKHSITGIIKISFALLPLTAVTVQLTRHISSGYSLVNFFSYFTNLSNIFAAVILLLGGIYLVSGKTLSPAFQLVRGASVVAMAVVGVVFSILLSGQDLGGLLPWVNIVLHYLMPIVIVVDWIVTPPRIQISLRQAMAWLVFPLAYVIYSLIHGAIVGWYPYFFLNPAKAGGPAAVAGYCVGILVLFVVFALAVRFIAGKAGARKVA